MFASILRPWAEKLLENHKSDKKTIPTKEYIIWRMPSQICQIKRSKKIAPL